MSEVWAVVIGTVLGFGLSTGYAEIRAWLSGRKLENEVRRMLWLEIERNLDLASELQQSLGQHGYDASQRLVRALVLVQSPLPPWSQAVWLSHLDKVADAVPKHQTHLVFRHHGHIDSMHHDYEKLCRLREQQLEGRIVGGRAPLTPFNDQGPEILERFERELIGLKTLGNPIRLW